jgi:hypothetical protein
LAVGYWLLAIGCWLLANGGYPIIIPIMVAESSEANVPAQSARNPSFESKVRFSGTSEPMPPICIPMDAKFANPHKM